MTSARQLRKSSVSIRSPTYWSLLGLIIERPDYGYGLVQRFRREFGDALPLSTDSHVYEGLRALERSGLIEEYGSRGGRQPALRYRAMPEGIRAYAEWLMARIRAERLRTRLFARQLAALAAVPELGLEVIDHYERACLEDEGPGILEHLASPGADSLAVALPAEQARLAAQAELPWVSYARRRFKKLAEEHR
jgi:DNA-binding PadR family transcriptional regulator